MRLASIPRSVAGSVGVVFVIAYAVALAWALEARSYNVWGSLLLAPIIGVVNAVLIWRVGKREDDRWVVGLMGTGFVLKMLGSFARYFQVFVIYGGVGDAMRYNNYATSQHVLWRQGFFVWTPQGKIGTQNLELVTTAVYTIIGPAPLAGFLVFASLAYWGVYLLYRAFRTALPNGNHRLYAAAVFLLPSILFWPSSIGKEAWLMLWVGATALGTAKLFARQSGAWTLLVLGALGTSMIRPHMTVLLVAAILVAQAFRPTQEAIGLVSKAFGVLVLIGVVVIFTTQSAQFLGIEDLSVDAVTGSVEWAGGQTETGGSAFTPVPLSDPLGVPMAFITMLFRPFLWEAHGAPMLLQSLEGLLMAWLFWRYRSSLRQLPRLMRENPYVTFAVVFVIAFTLAFAGFGNFGILARQRTLMLPFVLVVLALPVRRPRAAQALVPAQRTRSWV